jgi:hypothetical protein
VFVPKNKPMTTEEYIHCQGNKCPFCHSDDVNGGALTVDGKEVWQEVCCNDCGLIWTDFYTLTGYEVTV